MNTDDPSALRAHIADKLRSASLEMLPFPYVSISNFFPEEVYRGIIELNPFRKNRGKEWTVPPDPNRGGARTPYTLRKQINLHTLHDLTGTAEEIAFWNFIRNALFADDWFFHRVFDKFPAYFQLRFGEALAWPDFWPQLRKEMFLQRHDANYHIGPHTDVPTRIFTCLFSFPSQTGFEEYGTQILRPVDRTIRCSGRLHHEFAGFELIDTVPYVPNQFFMFFKTRQSFHAVKHIPDDMINERFGMQIQCYEPGMGLFKDISHPDVLAPRPMRIREPQGAGV